MPSPTPNKGLVYPTHGGAVDAWDTPVNADWNAIDAALGGVTSLNVTALSGVQALTLNQYTPPIIEITGVLTANVNYQLPSGVGGYWSIQNSTTGAFTVTWSSAGGGTTVAVPQGFTSAVVCDGTNVSSWSNTPVNLGSPTNGQLLIGDAGNFVIANLTAGANITITNTAGGITIDAAVASGVTSFNLRTGAVTLTAADVTNALTYTPVNRAGDTMSGALTVPAANVSGAAGVARPLFFQTAASDRWVAQADSAAESGANAGSNFAIVRYNDAGAPIDTPFSINRKTGLASFADGINVAGPVTLPPASLPLGTINFQYAQFRNQQASGSGSGETLSASAWTQRALNTTAFNTIVGATLSANQISLPAGTYQVTAVADAQANSGVTSIGHTLRVRDVTNSATLVVGPASAADTSGTQFLVCQANLQGRFVLAGTTTIEVDSWVSAAASGNAGTPATGEANVFVDIYLSKIG